MTLDDKQHFAETLSLFGEIHRLPISANLLSAYWTALKDMSRMDFDRAREILIKKALFFPKPAEWYSGHSRRLDLNERSDRSRRYVWLG